MVVLIAGATGFIGQRLVKALHSQGHVVIGLRRGEPTGPGEIQGDFAHDLEPQVWIPRLRGIDIVINAVGIIRERPGQSFEAIHSAAPKALFAACAVVGVRRVIQISALGADRGTTAYFLSKRSADDFLATQVLDWTIIQPALVFGANGASAGLFTTLASLPLIPTPGQGGQLLQPIHVDDLVEAICNLISSDFGIRCRVPLSGPQWLCVREMLARLRRAMHLGTPHFIGIPLPLMRALARLGELSGSGLLNTDTLRMLEQGNTADSRTTKQLLRRAPRPVEDFIADAERAAVVQSAKLRWLLPLLRFSIAVVWIWTGIVSLGLYPRSASYALLARAYVPHGLAPLLLDAAAMLDIALGLATMLLRRRRVLWLIQMATLLAYTLIISVALPQFWLHPYGPVLKNLPLLAAIYLLYSLENTPWNTSS